VTARVAITLFCDSCSVGAYAFSIDIHSGNGVSIARIIREAPRGWRVENRPGQIYALCPSCRRAKVIRRLR
jgi:hypothetical protein